MLKVDKAIYDIDKVISENIVHFKDTDRGLLSQNILSQLRNLVEVIAAKIYLKDDTYSYKYTSNITEPMNKLKTDGKLRFLYEFHNNMLQKTTSHYTMNKQDSERLMLKYFEYLLRIKKYLKNEYNMDILNNIYDFPLNIDKELFDYYAKIANRIEQPSKFRALFVQNQSYYVQKVKPFFINNEIYYEITFTAANSYVSKFDRVIAFSKCDIVKNYAIKFSMHTDVISIYGKNIAILIIDDFEVSIRQCEFINLSKIFGERINVEVNTIEYKELMKYLTNSRMPLSELVACDQNYYNIIKNQIIERAKTVKIFNVLDNCREIILNKKSGTNILLYLLYNMNNMILRSQYCDQRCEALSNLNLKYGCIPFEKMPYCTSLCMHNPQFTELFNSISLEDREHELLARRIKNNIENEGLLFTPINDIRSGEECDINYLINKYNSSLYYKHEYRKLNVFKNHIYIQGYVDDCFNIIKKLQELSSSGVFMYKETVESWLLNSMCKIDDENKKEILQRMFADSSVALIYGAAGTGKTTLINYISNFWGNQSKIFLSNTHPAVDNLRMKISSGNSKYETVAAFLSNSNHEIQTDILVIDECSTISNKDMRDILEKAKFELLVLVGDIYQIESILFGNWFDIAKDFLPKKSIFELSQLFRTTDENLLNFWNQVRNYDDSILETAVRNGYTAKLDESIFESNGDDEIILCLNYDGLYGINNINRFLQCNNPNTSVSCGVNNYKIGDPVLFNETKRFSPLIHNNSKGKIFNIEKEDNEVKFFIELDRPINSVEANKYGINLVSQSQDGKSIISFYVVDEGDSNKDEQRGDLTIVPFQVAYAVSIHKAQGLEYDSVKVVISNEVEERITHSIFYTAITRAKNKLKIYWSPETEKAVLESFDQNNSKKDANLLAVLKSLKWGKEL